MARLILILLFSVIGFNAQCQLTLSASKLVQDPQDVFYIDIIAEQGFDSIAAIQFGMKWDSSIIEFQDIDDFNLATSNLNTHFSFAYLSNGLLPFAWLHPSATSDLPSGSTIMRFKFKAIGPASSVTAFDFVNTNTANIKALAGDDFHDIDVIIEQGEVKLSPVSTDHPISELEELVISPNPSLQDINIRFSLNQPVDLTWSVSDIYGRTIFNQPFAQASGQQNIFIDREIFPESGVYLFCVKSAQGLLTRKLIVQQ